MAAAVAERLTLGAAVRLEMHPDAVVALRLLVGGLVSARLVDSSTEDIRRGAAIMVDGFNEQWRLVAARSYAAGHSIAAAAVEFAWLTAPSPLGSALSIDDAVATLRGEIDADADAGPINVVVAVARAQDPTQRDRLVA